MKINFNIKIKRFNIIKDFMKNIGTRILFKISKLYVLYCFVYYKADLYRWQYLQLLLIY